MSTPKLIKFRGAVYRKIARPFIAPKLPEAKAVLSSDQQVQLLRYSVKEWNRWYKTTDEPGKLLTITPHNYGMGSTKTVEARWLTLIALAR